MMNFSAKKEVSEYEEYLNQNMEHELHELAKYYEQEQAEYEEYLKEWYDEDPEY